jgi:hypothetical protein
MFLSLNRRLHTTSKWFYKSQKRGGFRIEDELGELLGSQKRNPPSEMADSKWQRLQQ